MYPYSYADDDPSPSRTTVDPPKSSTGSRASRAAATSAEDAPYEIHDVVKSTLSRVTLSLK